MKCIYQKTRTKNYKKYIYCNDKKSKITFYDCKNCENKQYKKIKQIKKKSDSLAKLERNRYSILTKDMNMCYICNKRKRQDLHEIFGR